MVTMVMIAIEQLDKADRIIDFRRNKVFYQIENEDDPTKDPYHVEFNDQLHMLTCACQGDQDGQQELCQHIRIALVADQLYKLELRRERQREQEEVEKTEAHALEQAMDELEEAQALLEAFQSVGMSR